METPRNLLDDIQRPPSARHIWRPENVYIDPTTFHEAYPELSHIPMTYLRHSMRKVSRHFLEFPISPIQLPASAEQLKLPMDTWPAVPSHIFKIPVLVGGQLTFHFFPIHAHVFMVMCAKLKKLPLSLSSDPETQSSIQVPVVEYYVPAPLSFPLFQEHIYTMDHDLLKERFIGVRLPDLERERDAVLSQIPLETLFVQANLIHGFYNNACDFGFYDEQTFDVIETCWNYLYRARHFQTGATTRST
ncbi:hypothetical protein JR316_0008841 [Psilocybe cubensis]|uniref:Uncharacterized protein n=2 Tax=Psilocybe cubensis TaxID=181762 RepID=A0A8H7XYN4_PSICU|nr:hypothetical protein JR316_0008841 [Psilocybe cubensis]KAH9478387.1 hypothetical protein JR316_0008841 [Psilocybe cubensis]